MPFKSEAQRRFMYARHPKIAERWQKHTGKGADLPEKVSKKAAYELGFEVGCKQAARGGNPFAALQSLWRVFARNRAAQATMKKIPARPPAPTPPVAKTPVQSELERMKAEQEARTLQAQRKGRSPAQRMGGY